MPTPNAMPRKTNLIHQLILAGLVATKPTSWVHKRFDGDDLVKAKVAGTELRNPLAQNVSEHNLNIMARRWAA